MAEEQKGYKLTKRAIDNILAMMRIIKSRIASLENTPRSQTRGIVPADKFGYFAAAIEPGAEGEMIPSDDAGNAIAGGDPIIVRNFYKRTAVRADTFGWVGWWREGWVYKTSECAAGE